MSADRQRDLRLLTWLLAIAIAVSVVHYADNYFNYEDFPHGTGPEPSAGLVLAGWFILTPLAIAGWVYFRRGDDAVARPAAHGLLVQRARRPGPLHGRRHDR